MKTKIKKLLFEYTKNSRITTKELGKNIGASQQSASYLLNNLKKRKLIQDTTTIVDAVKLGYINVLVGLNFLRPETSIKKEILEELKNINSITSIEEGKEGIDLLVEYTVHNLSSFNKTHLELISRLFNRLKTVFVFPMIVCHEYDHNYLTSKISSTDRILFGDRELKELSENEEKILNELIKTPDKKIIDISETLKLPPKTIVNLKRALEKKNIIKGYSAILNHNKLGINRQIIFLKFTSIGIQQIEKFYDFTRNQKNIVKFIKIIGEYQLGIYVEDLNEIEIIKDIRANFPVDSYLIMKSEKIHKKNYLPEEEV